MEIFPQNGSLPWSGMARWLPQWFYNQPETIENPDPTTSISLTQTSFTAPLPSAYYHLEDDFTGTVRDSIFNAFSKEIHLLTETTTTVGKSLLFSPTQVGYSQVYIIPGEITTLQLETSAGWISVPKLDSLSDGLNMPYLGYYTEEGITLVFNVGVKEVQPTTVSGWDYIQNSDRHPYLPIYIKSAQNLWLLSPSQIGSDGLIPIQNVESAYYYLYSNLPSLNFKINGVESLIQSYDPTDSSDTVSFLYNMPFTNLITSSVRNRYATEFIQNQSKLHIEGILSLIFNDYSITDLSFGDTTPTKFIAKDSLYEILEFKIEDTHLLDDYLDYIIYRYDGTTTKSLTDPQRNRIVYLRSRYPSIYNSYDRTLLIPNINTESIIKEMGDCFWMQTANNELPASSEFL